MRNNCDNRAKHMCTQCEIAKNTCMLLHMAAGNSFDPIQISTGVGDRSGERRVLADFAFIDSELLAMLIMPAVYTLAQKCC